MNDADARLAAAPAEPGPAGERPRGVAAVRRSGTTLIASGQVAVRDGKLLAEGRVGEDVTFDTARSCARQCARNVLTAVQDELGGLGLGGIERIEGVTVWVACVPGFTGQHLVADAATELFVEVLGDTAGRHARVAVGVAALPTGSPVEVQATFRLRS